MTVADEITKAALELFKKVMANRDFILRAFVAETGLVPSECTMVETEREGGQKTWHVERNTDPTERQALSTAIAVLGEENKALLANLSLVQERCTALMLENRAYRNVGSPHDVFREAMKRYARESGWVEFSDDSWQDPELLGGPHEGRSFFLGHAVNRQKQRDERATYYARDDVAQGNEFDEAD